MTFLLFIGLRRVDAKVQRLIRNHREHAEGDRSAAPAPGFDLAPRIDDLFTSLGEDRLTILAQGDALSDRLDKGEERVTSLISVLSDEVTLLRPHLDALHSKASTPDPWFTELSERLKSVGHAGETAYRQLEAYVDLRGLVRPRAPMPPLRDWAASPDVMRLLAETMWRSRPGLVVECGSGSSSVWLGYLAEQTASGRVVALEHDERFAEISRDLVRAHGLEDVVEIRHAPLTTWDDADRSYQWYDRNALADLTDIGLLFVDGPPQATGSEARFPAMRLLLPKCTADAVIVLDDADRDDEKTLSDRWLAEHPELERSTRRFDKGAHVFVRRRA
ncbi:class I SAM-dependent methyltransferase [Actinomadura alba]|uniref:Class I SAM-dependent methyltransferase n=2 Tax=Actinomadura alba TaxID=406431 RepID=A0ABR7LJX1_9ACTN|nr:class I SAM-dependent methyltransferase [Actinomadura alba]